MPAIFSNIPISSKHTTERIKIYIDSPKAFGWNEIDAVGLADTQWASKATASSTLANQFQSPIVLPSF